MRHLLHQPRPPTSAKQRLGCERCKARFAGLCVCVWQVGGFSKMGGLVSDGGRRSYCLPDLYHRGMDHQMYMCVRESVLCCAGRACRLCIGRVHQHVVR